MHDGKNVKTSYNKIYKFFSRESSVSGHHIHTSIKSKYKQLSIHAIKLGLSKKSGHNTSGHYTIKSKGHTVKYKRYLLSNNLFNMGYFVYMFWFIKSPRTNKIYTSVISLDGSIRYLPYTSMFRALNFSFTGGYVKLFKLVGWSLFKISRYGEMLDSIGGRYTICYVSEIFGGIAKYAKASGSTCIIFLKRGMRKCGYSWVKLPSGKLKCISIKNQALFGAIKPTKTNRIKCTHAGFWRNMGKKPTVRGVAKNPVDHPHGGRAGSVRKPRSPWGWYTK